MGNGCGGSACAHVCVWHPERWRVTRRADPEIEIGGRHTRARVFGIRNKAGAVVVLRARGHRQAEQLRSIGIARDQPPEAERGAGDIGDRERIAALVAVGIVTNPIAVGEIGGGEGRVNFCCKRADQRPTAIGELIARGGGQR